MPMPEFEGELPDLAVRQDAGNFFVTTMESNLQLYDLSVDPSESKTLLVLSQKWPKSLRIRW